MLKIHDVYASALEVPLQADDGSGPTTYGRAHLRYEVRQLSDVRNLTFVRAYVVTSRVRVVLPNPNTFAVTANDARAFADYPALFRWGMSVSGPSAASASLVRYAPRTVNTSVGQAASQNQGSNAGTSSERTVGSSVSQTNSFGLNLSGGFFGEDPTGSLGGDFTYSKTRESFSSNTSGSSAGTTEDAGTSATMSIKDWAAYSFTDTTGVMPTWVWGQEYPWDVIQFRYTASPGSDDVAVPYTVQVRLVDLEDDTHLAFPPSHLALFGVDVTMLATWRVDLPTGIDEQNVTVEHSFAYARGSHGLGPGPSRSGGVVQGATDVGGSDFHVKLSPVTGDFTVPATTLELTTLGLDPIQDGRADNGAAIGFLEPSKFLAVPRDGKPFKILSDGNVLQVAGTGFDEPMSTRFSNGDVTLSIAFKIVDQSFDYVMFFKHWNLGAVGCQLSLVFNGNTASPVIRHVDSQEGQGGDDNLDAISLRSSDYTSIDYHDYLVLGLNTVEVTVTPDGAGAGYVLRALAIGED